MERIEGDRTGGYVYIYDGSIYSLNRRVKNKLYLRCKEEGCNSSVIIQNIKGKCLAKPKPHNHYPCFHKIETLRMKAELREKARFDNRRLRTIYNEVCLRYPYASTKVTFKNVSSFMQRTRSRNAYPVSSKVDCEESEEPISFEQMEDETEQIELKHIADKQLEEELYCRMLQQAVVEATLGSDEEDSYVIIVVDRNSQEPID